MTQRGVQEPQMMAGINVPLESHDTIYARINQNRINMQLKLEKSAMEYKNKYETNQKIEPLI